MISINISNTLLLYNLNKVLIVFKIIIIFIKCKNKLLNPLKRFITVKFFLKTKKFKVEVI
jgi:hypothetical protein